METLTIKPELIGFDFDGVIADIGEAFLRLACEKYNYCSLKLEEITSFRVETCTSIPEEIVQSIFGDILQDSLATGLLPIPGAVEVLTMLAQRSGITIITARDQANPVIDWVERFFPAAVGNKILVVAMGDHDRKVGYIRDHNLHYFVDDRIETCAQVAEAGLIPLLYQQPWNRMSNGYTTVANWQDIHKLISV